MPPRSGGEIYFPGHCINFLCMSNNKKDMDALKGGGKKKIASKRPAKKAGAKKPAAKKKTAAKKK